MTYKAEGNDPQMWEFNPRRLKASAGELIEKRYGEPLAIFQRDLVRGSMLARRVLLWYLIRLTNNYNLRFEDTPDFYAEELEVEFSRAELELMRAEAKTSRALSNEDREIALAVLDAEIAKAPTGVDEGKALSATDSPATG